MTTFYICRHGETENNKAGRFSGWIDTPLTALGVQNAASSAVKLRDVSFDKIIASDLGRAFTTAYIIATKNGYVDEIERRSEFREVNYGDFANLSYSAGPEIPPAEYATYVPPNGESLVSMQQRVIDGVDSIAANNPGKTILLVAHDGTINALRGSFKGEDMGVADQVRNAHDFVAKFDYGDGKIHSFSKI